MLTASLIALLAFLALASTEADEEDVIVASASSAKNSHSATLLTDGRVLVAGGWSGTTAIATRYRGILDSEPPSDTPSRSPLALSATAPVRGYLPLILSGPA